MYSSFAVALVSFVVTSSAVPIVLPNVGCGILGAANDFFGGGPGCTLSSIPTSLPKSDTIPTIFPTSFPKSDTVPTRLATTAIAPTTAPSQPASVSSGPVDGRIFVCDTWNFQGNCQSIGFADNTCQNFPSNFQDTISSIKPDDGWNCQAFGNNDCNDNQGILSVSAPGIPQMTTMNDALSSFKCLRQ